MIDVLLASYNGMPYIRQQLLSLFRQKNVRIRLVIRDDGSTDGTQSEIRRIMARYQEYRKARPEEKYGVKEIIFTEGEPTGSPAGCFTAMLPLVKSRYVMLADQDDVWDPFKSIDSLAAIRKMEKRYGRNTPILVHTDLEVTDEEGNRIADSFLKYQNLPRRDRLQSLLIQNTVTGCTVIMNRPLADLYRQGDPGKSGFAHDHYLAVLAAAAGEVGLLDRPLVQYRQHGDNAVGAWRDSSPVGILRRIRGGKKTFREKMMQTYRQAGDIAGRYAGDISPEKLELLRGYALLAYAPAGEKRKYFLKNGIRKKGVMKQIMQNIWC